MPTIEHAAGPEGQDVRAVRGGAAFVTNIECWLVPYFKRWEFRERAMAHLRGLSPAERKNS